MIASRLSGGVLSLGSLVGFLTVVGIPAPNRLSPILMTTPTTALALVPLVVMGDIHGLEIKHPLVAAILGGLVTSTLVKLFIVPSLHLGFAKRLPARERGPRQPQPVTAV